MYFCLEFNDSDSYKKGINKVIAEFKLARTKIEEGIDDPLLVEGILDEYTIMSFKKYSGKTEGN